jgi:hypothetical protein
VVRGHHRGGLSGGACSPAAKQKSKAKPQKKQKNRKKSRWKAYPPHPRSRLHRPKSSPASLKPQQTQAQYEADKTALATAETETSGDTLAAELWEIVQSVVHGYCGGCKVIAGEFQEDNGVNHENYIKSYSNKIVALAHGKCTTRGCKPEIWGLHDYHDVVHETQQAASEFAKQVVTQRLSKKFGPRTENGDASGESGSGIGSIALGGSMVAFEESITGSEREGNNTNGKWIVVVRNLRTGKVVHRVPTGTLVPPNPMDVGAGPTTALVVKGDSAVAWITEVSITEGSYQVHALDKTGSRLVASGADIKPYALQLKGSRLYWKQGDQVQSTILS